MQPFELNPENSLKVDVVKGAKTIFHKGLVEIGEGNVSVRIPNRDELYITPTFNNYQEINEDDVVHLKFNGEQLSEGKQAFAEYRLHISIYKARPRAKCVIHTHSPYATMLSVARKGIPVFHADIGLGG